MTDPRAILHVDMDAFYASVEQRDRPELRGQPVIVGGTSNRGVVAAASYEVRKFGVRSAMPIREALRRCPHAIVVRHHMDRYAEASRGFFAILDDYSPEVEGLSFDESFLDLTGSERLLGPAREVGVKIKQRVRDGARTSPLFDSARYTKNLEALYRVMWKRHAAGLAPAAIDVNGEVR
jgi:DNA polymerase-4